MRKILKLLLPAYIYTYLVQVYIYLSCKIKIYKIFVYCNLHKKNNTLSKNYIEAANFLYKYGDTMYPSLFSLKYEKIYKSICVSKDENGMKFVLHRGNRLYFPTSMSDLKIAKLYQSLITEQDLESPHVYEYNDFRIEKGDVLFDVGAAEGIFTLEHIDKLEHAYLFECDINWIKALMLTFAPWNDKITIIPKYVSNENTEVSTTIDQYVQLTKCEVDFIKIDIEGAEMSALQGAKCTLLHNSPRVSICTYHRPEDEKVISHFLSDLGYHFLRSERLIWTRNIIPPFFRLGVLYAYK